jgi:hypothetical protein
MKELLTQQRNTILDRWKKVLLDAYPAELTPFLEGEDDRFRNPVGYAIVQGLEGIYDGLVGSTGDTAAAIEEIIRIRAVQEFSPSEAVGFLMPLKGLIREAAQKAAKKSPDISSSLLAEIIRVETEIDRMTMFAVDCYVQCREAVFRVRVREARSGGMIGASIMRRKLG